MVGGFSGFDRHHDSSHGSSRASLGDYGSSQSTGTPVAEQSRELPCATGAPVVHGTSREDHGNSRQMTGVPVDPREFPQKIFHDVVATQ